MSMSIKFSIDIIRKCTHESQKCDFLNKTNIMTSVDMATWMGRVQIVLLLDGA